MPSETSDGFPPNSAKEFVAQENSNREFCKAKLGKQGFALRRGNEFGAQDSLPQNCVNKFGAQDSSPTNCVNKFGTKDSFRAPSL